MKRLIQTSLALLALTSAYATPFTETSPTSEGGVPTGVTAIGGIVLDIVGLNGARLVAQQSAGSLWVGYATTTGNFGDPTTDPLVIGTQGGLTAGLLAQLGGGISELAVRMTLFDGDTGAGNFDSGDNTLLLNGINIGNWSSVQAQNTNAAGTVAGSFSGGGFRDNTLDTGWFLVTNGATLAAIFASIQGSNQVIYSLDDTDPGDNYFDFTQGVDGGLVNVETPPVITPPSNVPDGGATLALLGSSLLGMGMLRRRFLV
jgi:VPDSG-CTERM motif